MSDNRHRATRDERAYGIPEAYSAPRDEALRDLAAEARHGGRYITDALARAITNDGIRARFAGEDGSEALAEIWRYTASPSGSQYPASGRDTTQRYATSAARIGGVDWEHSAYWQPQPLAEAVFDWPVYRAALTAWINDVADATCADCGHNEQDHTLEPSTRIAWCYWCHDEYRPIDV